MLKAISWLITLFLFILMILVGGYSYYVNYQYERDIGSYFDNARDSITPEAILIQLDAGRLAMINEGLTEDLYGAWIFKKPDNSMKFQYQHLDGIIERANAVKEWKEATYGGEVTTTENFKDVYNEKMDNLRNYIHAEGFRSDWIAEDTWYVENHLILHLGIEWILALLFIIMLFISFALSSEY